MSLKGLCVLWAAILRLSGVGWPRVNPGSSRGSGGLLRPGAGADGMARPLWAFQAQALLALLSALPWLAPAQAHEIPADVRVQAFVRATPQALQLLMRVPLAAMREVELPLRGPGYLDLEQAPAKLREAADLWLLDNVRAFDAGASLPRPTWVAARISLASDKSFSSLETALAHLRAPPVPPQTDLHWREQLMDVLLEFPIASPQSEFALDLRLARLGLKVKTVVRYVAPGGAERVFELHDGRSFVRLDPRWHQAALSFASLGLEHILTGVDHLLFLLALVIPFRRLLPLAALATAFTLAHSVTLLAAALGYAPSGLWFPPLVETLVAASIVWVCLENLIPNVDLRRRLSAAFGFGLVHGFAFSSALGDELQFAGQHLLTSLLAFNLGVEAGQLLILLLAVPLLSWVLRSLPERGAIIVLSALVAHTAWHWMIERGEVLLRFPTSSVDPASLASLLRWVLAGFLMLWGLRRLYARLSR